jgi:hypothetical protein
MTSRFSRSRSTVTPTSSSPIVCGRCLVSRLSQAPRFCYAPRVAPRDVPALHLIWPPLLLRVLRTRPASLQRVLDAAAHDLPAKVLVTVGVQIMFHAAVLTRRHIVWIVGASLNHILCDHGRGAASSLACGSRLGYSRLWRRQQPPGEGRAPVTSTPSVPALDHPSHASRPSRIHQQLDTGVADRSPVVTSWLSRRGTRPTASQTLTACHQSRADGKPPSASPRGPDASATRRRSRVGLRSDASSASSRRTASGAASHVAPRA